VARATAGVFLCYMKNSSPLCFGDPYHFSDFLMRIKRGIWVIGVQQALLQRLCQFGSLFFAHHWRCISQLFGGEHTQHIAHHFLSAFWCS